MTNVRRNTQKSEKFSDEDVPMIKSVSIHCAIDPDSNQLRCHISRDLVTEENTDFDEWGIPVDEEIVEEDSDHEHRRKKVVKPKTLRRAKDAEDSEEDENNEVDPDYDDEDDDEEEKIVKHTPTKKTMKKR